MACSIYQSSSAGFMKAFDFFANFEALGLSSWSPCLCRFVANFLEMFPIRVS